MRNTIAYPTQQSSSFRVVYPVFTNEEMTAESQRYNCFTRNGGNANPKHAGPEAKGSNRTTGLTLLWTHYPFRGNFKHWQVSRVNFWRDFWIRETKTGQQVAQLHERYVTKVMNKTRKFSKFSKNNKIFNCMKFCPVLAELLDLDGRTDSQTDRHDKANSSFSQFCERA